MENAYKAETLQSMSLVNQQARNVYRESCIQSLLDIPFPEQGEPGATEERDEWDLGILDRREFQQPMYRPRFPTVLSNDQPALIEQEEAALPLIFKHLRKAIKMTENDLIKPERDERDLLYAEVRSLDDALARVLASFERLSPNVALGTWESHENIAEFMFYDAGNPV